jgi:tetratricopeptide (TPR) repeat protein
MSSLRAFKQKLAAISRLWESEDYDAALAEVDELRKTWPGNAHLHIMWASLVQLQEDPKHNLDEAKQALQHAIEFDDSSPAPAIELGHFLDAVEDNPRAAAKAFAEGVALARQQLLEGLIGQAKALLQLNKRKEAVRCVREALRVELKGPIAEEIEELLSEVLASRSA